MGGGAMGGGGPPGGTITWSAGDTIAVTFIGQICDGCPNAAAAPAGGGMGMAMPTRITFSFMAYENLTTGIAPIASRTIFSSQPFNWAPIFGPAPTGP